MKPHPHSLGSVTILTFISSYLSPHSLHIVLGLSVDRPQSQNRWKACHCCRHELKAPQLHATCNKAAFFSTDAAKKTTNARGDICGWTSRSNCFVYMWTMYKKRHLKRKDAAALKARSGGTTVSSLSLSTPCPICINSYVTMASVYNRLSSAAAVAHRNRK